MESGLGWQLQDEMTEVGTKALFADEGEPAVARHRIGETIVVIARGMVLASYRQGDEVGRDVAIVTLLNLGMGLKTDVVAELCDVSHGWVCEIRKRDREGGMAAVVARAKPGPPRVIVGRKQERLREMHGKGSTPMQIARALGVSKGLVAKEIKRLGLPKRGWETAQKALPGIGESKRKPGKKKAESPVQSAPVLESTGMQSVAREGTPTAESAQMGAEQETSEKPAQEQAEQSRMTHDKEAPTVDSTHAEMTTMPSIEQTQLAMRAEVDALVVAVGEASGAAEREATELQAGAPLAAGPSEHPCRYAGTLLLCAAAAALGVSDAIVKANVIRPEAAVYDARQVLLALLAGWGAGYSSLEAMHERDARALGVVLGLERSPSVRTLHRAIAQMSAVSDPIKLQTELARGVLAARLPERLWFGMDGHFKAYSGEASIDKGWDSKRRIASKGITDILVTDERGWTWQVTQVAAGDSLSMHLLTRARALRGVVGDSRPIVIAFDRGGFDFDVLNALDLDGFGYVGYVPASVSLPDLSTIAPASDGVAEQLWTHHRLRHRARLIVERDGTALIPSVTNLPTLVDTEEVSRGLSARRGAQENSIKAARAFAHIDKLPDRGGATLRPDDRLVPNPTRAEMKKELQEVQKRSANLQQERGSADKRERSTAAIKKDQFWANVDERAIQAKLRETPAKVKRIDIEPDALRAALKTHHRLLLQPFKYVADNARRWLLGMLDSALAPTDHTYDQDTHARTLFALLRAPGTVRFGEKVVTVTLDLPLPPTAHRRLAEALEKLDHPSLKFTDGRRRIVFRLAPRPTRESLPHRASTLAERV